MSVMTRKDAERLKQDEALPEIASREGRYKTAERLQKNLSLASAEAWSLTERLLSLEIRSHGINPALINPLLIAEDTRLLFQKALDAYRERLTPPRLAAVLGGDCGALRKKYTAEDPRAIGFVSMQFHYTGQMLLDWLSEGEKVLFEPYLKVMDDHMYMPLKDAYQAAARHSYHSPVLAAVQHLLPISSEIARSVCDKVCRINPDTKTYNGALHNPIVRISSIRDVEMFQVYLCLCVLEDSIRAVQQELFPLCVMLYPPLNVDWKLVQDMLQAMTWEMLDTLSSQDMEIFLPYLKELTAMFSKEVFSNP
jgi:hypothetical protein